MVRGCDSLPGVSQCPRAVKGRERKAGGQVCEGRGREDGEEESIPSPSSSSGLPSVHPSSQSCFASPSLFPHLTHSPFASYGLGVSSFPHPFFFSLGGKGALNAGFSQKKKYVTFHM